MLRCEIGEVGGGAGHGAGVSGASSSLLARENTLFLHFSMLKSRGSLNGKTEAKECLHPLEFTE